MDYYCASKFTELAVHVQSRSLYNCCAAGPERISVEWLEKNPGRIFNTDTMLNDRRLMLENKSCDSCHQGCYKNEQMGIASVRQLRKPASEKLTNASLQDLTVSLSNDCNLSCVYCSPEWSTSWQKEIDKKGDYQLDGFAIKNKNWNQLWAKMKQKQRTTESKFFSLLLREIDMAKELKKIIVTGGEPLLNNHLLELLDHTAGKRIELVTGLGVSNSRLKSIIEKYKNMDLHFHVSAEATGKYFEFIRYGNQWKKFLDRLELLRNSGSNIAFISTITNLSLFDLHNFYDHFAEHHEISYSGLTGLQFMSPHVLDSESKQLITDRLADYNVPDQLLRSIGKEPSDWERRNMGLYLNKLCEKRNLDLDFLPKNFVEWCDPNQSN